MADAMFPYAPGDTIGTLRLLTDGVSGAATLRRVYTAFGQPALSEGAATTRYGYAGAWGYESFGFADLPFLHVGERWYDPSTGRFLQPDPIGIAGGLNVFLYVEHAPMLLIDPSGEGFWDGSNWFHEWVAEAFWMNVHDTETLAGMSDLRAGAEAVGVSVVAGAGGYFGGKYLVCRFLRAPPQKPRVIIKYRFGAKRQPLHQPYRYPGKLGPGYTDRTIS